MLIRLLTENRTVEKHYIYIHIYIYVCMQYIHEIHENILFNIKVIALFA